MSTETLSGQQVADLGLDGWAFLLHYGVYGLQTRIHTKSFATGLELIGSIGRAAEELDRPADLDLRRTRVDVRLNGDGDGSGTSGITELDLSLVRKITQLAADAGTEIECASIAQLELGLDTPDWKEIGQFWAAVLDSEVVGDGDWADVGDRSQLLPLIWFQPSGRDEPRQRWHPDLSIDPAQVQPRIDAALAAGGKLISNNADTGCTLADPQGNKVCLSTWRGRA
ncbi:VOC family protein [Microlunatus speluncae]|uniref:VOC family protein n=1 Tax=Microlunatus speluncae TaxID=2594267 RepID=UPI0012667C85|nr:VOC family protein [Microlunatus speluncae]